MALSIVAKSAKIAYLAVALVLGIPAAGQEPIDRLPAGTWSFLAGPSRLPSFPIDVYGVYTSAARRLSVEFIEIKNYGSEAIHRIRVGWMLTSEQAQIVAEGSVNIELTPALLPKQRYRIKHPFIHLGALIGPTDSLSGKYRLEVTARTIDAMEARIGQTGPVLEAVWIGNGSDGDDGWGRGCQNQNCTWSQEDGSYRCSQLTGYRCKVDDDGQGCYESRCPQ